MPMTEYSGNTEIITNIGTTPQERGLTTDEFKAKFDEGLKAFVTWFNDTHKTEFDAHLAEKASEEALGHVIVDGDTITIDENGVISGSGAETSNRTITVGTDKDFTTIQAAIDGIKKRVDADITINVDAGTYAEDITVSGFIGGGALIINGGTDLTTADNYNVNSFSFKNNFITIDIVGFKALTTTKPAFYFENGLRYKAQYCKTIASAITQPGFKFNQSIGYVLNCMASNKSEALSAALSRVFSRDWTVGSGNTKGLYSGFASTIGKYGDQPQGTTAEYAVSGGVIR